MLAMCLLLALPARAEHFQPTQFDGPLLARTYAAALGFIPPRALEPVSTPELTLWGLGSLTAIDPELVVDALPGAVRLSRAGTLLVSLAAPPSADSVGWSAVAVELTAVAWASSVAVRQTGRQQLTQSFFASMLSHLDPYSRYIGPSRAADEEEQREGDAGVGLDVKIVDGHAEVESVIDDAPAALAGMLPGDRILSVEGESTRGMTAEDLESLLAGAEGTSVKLRFQRGHHRRTVTLIRSQTPPQNVFSSREGDALLIRLTGFNTHTASRLGLAISKGFAAEHRPDGIVLDLRGNRGGLLRQAIGASDEFLQAGTVAITKGRDPAADHDFVSRPGTLAPDVPLIVLVDGHTASAAEVLAAALADRSRGVVVGSATYGKGLVQIVTRLPDGGELLLTWSRILAPRGWPLQGFGVLPQLCTSLGEAVAKDQFAQLKAGTRPMAAALARERDARPPVTSAEILSVRQSCPAAEGSDLDLSIARDLIADRAAYSTALLPPPGPHATATAASTTASTGSR